MKSLQSALTMGKTKLIVALTEAIGIHRCTCKWRFERL
jgi:hypothetical protein